MMMVFMKVKSSTEKNMEMENIILKMVTSMKVKCIKEKCKAEVNTLGQIKIYIKEPSFKIK